MKDIDEIPEMCIYLIRRISDNGGRIDRDIRDGMDEVEYSAEFWREIIDFFNDGIDIHLKNAAEMICYRAAAFEVFKEILGKSKSK